MAKVVLLEDDVDLREEIAAFLGKRGLDIVQAGCIGEFLPLIGSVSIAIIDVMLPDGNGFDAAMRLRQADKECGIIMLTARGATQDKLKGFEGGADHYLVKPIKLLELGAIIDALRRRVLTGWRFVTNDRQLVAPDGSGMVLTSHETILCQLLAGSPGQGVTRRRIVEAFGYDWLDYDQRRLDTLVSRLRRRWFNKIGKELPLKTEHREGYSFAATISLM